MSEPAIGRSRYRRARNRSAFSIPRAISGGKLPLVDGNWLPPWMPIAVTFDGKPWIIRVETLTHGVAEHLPER